MEYILLIFMPISAADRPSVIGVPLGYVSPTGSLDHRHEALDIVVCDVFDTDFLGNVPLACLAAHLQYVMTAYDKLNRNMVREKHRRDRCRLM